MCLLKYRIRSKCSADLLLSTFKELRVYHDDQLENFTEKCCRYQFSNIDKCSLLTQLAIDFMTVKKQNKKICDQFITIYWNCIFTYLLYYSQHSKSISKIILIVELKIPSPK